MATVQYGAMADMTISLDRAVFAGKTVHYAVVLNITALVQLDTTEVAAQYGIWANIALCADDNVADQYCRRMNKGIVGDDGNKVFYRIDGHVDFTDKFLGVMNATIDFEFYRLTNH